MGKTKIRVMLTTNGLPSTNSCACSNYGEVEDYSINVTSGPCEPKLQSKNLYITKIVLGGITKESTQNAKGYSNYAILENFEDAQSAPSIPVLKIGGYHKVEITSKNIGDINQLVNGPVKLYHKIWIDLNKNNIFENSELLCNAVTTNINKLLYNIKIPANATPGYYRMRVILSNNQDASACSNNVKGEAEDYLVNLSSNVYCEFTTANKNLWIQKFSLDPSLANESGNNNGYAKFSKDNISLKPGSSYHFNIRLGKTGNIGQVINQLPTVYIKIWIDFNKNKVFENNESVYSYNTNTAAMEFKGYFNMPANSQKGVTTMRVLVSNNVGSACGALNNGVATNGEAEDYIVNITDDTYCMNALNIKDMWIKNVLAKSNNQYFQNPSTYKNGYEDFTDKQIGIFAPNDSIYVGIFKGFSAGEKWGTYGAWIDYNQNYIFEKEEAIEFSIMGIGAASGIFKVPVNVKQGKTRMRVMVLNNNNVDGPPLQNACVNPLAQGEYEDYTIEFKGAFCQVIINIKAVMQQNLEALISWDLTKNKGTFADYESFEVHYKEKGANTYYNKILTTNKQVILKGLNYNLTYEYYVTGNCKSGKVYTSNSFEFKTPVQNVINNVKVGSENNWGTINLMDTIIIDKQRTNIGNRGNRYSEK
ncbi:MAG: hypothetical protein IPJ81_00295 [Chitinophagaceae bacterium]|nr:hypothetical protein [Chitinophagaceae bacterium]